ncbi:MAG: protein-tyrosine-phosphatase [Saprospiraceae bacterium]
MYPNLINVIASFSSQSISDERKEVLLPLVNYIQEKVNAGESIRLHFICTHNSRRSHLSQIWAQTMAYYIGLKNVSCYSGGTEATAIFTKVLKTLTSQGFQVLKLSENENPVVAVKFADNENPILCFSKTYDHPFNPSTQFGAVMTCSNADEGCPIVVGAEARFPIKYDDPKAYDGTPLQTEKYAERSLDIAREMWWVFSQIK